MTVFLALLAMAMVLFLRWGENRAMSLTHTATHLEELKQSLRIQWVYEKEPVGVRWLTGYLTENSFYREQNACAMVAERDGYLSPAARQIMALVAHRAGDPGKAAYWRDGPVWGVLEFSLPEENREILRKWAPDQKPSLAGILEDPADPFSSSKANSEYWISTKQSVAFIILGILLIPCGLYTTHLLKNRQDSEEFRSIHPECGAGAVFGAWLRAEWCFAFGGMALLAGYYVAYLMAEGSVLQGVSPLPGSVYAYLAFYAFLFDGWTSILISVGLITGPVWVLARKLTGGLAGMWDQFGLAWRGQNWTGHLKAGAGAAWLALMLGLLLNPMLLLLGWFDLRDAWRFQHEALWLQLFYGCLVAPLVEELIFRGFLFNGFTQRWSTVRAAGLSSFLFAGIHGYSLYGLVMIWLFGMLMCGLYWRIRSLWAPVLAHAFFNATLFLSAAF